MLPEESLVANGVGFASCPSVQYEPVTAVSLERIRPLLTVLSRGQHQGRSSRSKIMRIIFPVRHVTLPSATKKMLWTFVCLTRLTRMCEDNGLRVCATYSDTDYFNHL